VKRVCLKFSSKEKDELISGAVIPEPSKQGSTSSPKIQSLENIASLIIKNYKPELEFCAHFPFTVFSSNSIE